MKPSKKFKIEKRIIHLSKLIEVLEQEYNLAKNVLNPLTESYLKERDSLFAKLIPRPPRELSV